MGLLHRVLFFLCFSTCLATAQTLNLDHEVHRATTLASGAVATLTGKSELHLSGGGDPLPGCTVHLNSEDSWLFLHQVTPATVVSGFLSRIQVNGQAAVADGNVRVVQHVAGTVVIPQPSTFLPLEVFSGTHLSGNSRKLGPYTAYDNAALGAFGNNIRSFILKRGYTATFAQNDNGSGISFNYVAQDADLEVSLLPSALDRTISFVRIFPWRWTGKKGSCDVDPVALNADWNYNWNISSNSTRDWEYVAIRQQPFWPGLGQDWRARGINHLSGYNEPDNPVEDAYKNLSPPGSVNDAIAKWPDLLATGLRVGAPAVTDGGSAWIADFMNKANAAGLRVDYVPVHYYRSYWNKSDPAGAANQFYNFLKSIHDIAQRPIWVTEFNNGANWTDNAHDPDVTQNRNAIEAMVQMMDNTPWIERYAVYSRVEWFRQTHYDDGSITPMGAMYRDRVAPMAYRQAVPDSGSSPAADYLFEGNLRDTRSGNNPLAYGSPKLLPGKHGTALSFDGTDDYLALPARLGDSTDFSFTGWIKWGGGTDWQRIFDFGTGTNAYAFLSPRAGSGTLRFTLKNGGGEQQLNHNAPLPIDTWTHVAVTLTGTTGKLFVNGSLVATNTAMDINPGDIGTTANFIGDSQFAADPMFKGQLDDLRFHTTALSDSQVAALAGSTAPAFASELLVKPPATKHQAYNASITGDLTGGTATFAKIGGPAWLAVAGDGRLMGVPGLADGGVNRFLVSATTAQGAVATTMMEITVEEATGISARYAFNGNVQSSTVYSHGTASGGPTYVAGIRGQAIDLDGTDDAVILPAGIADHEEITIATWVNWDGGNNWQRIFDFGNGTGQYLFLTPKGGNGQMRFVILKDSVEHVMDASSPSIGSWAHVAVTIGGGTARLYVNGTQSSSVATALKPSDIRPAVNFIGDSQYPADPAFNGRLDEFVIFNRALSPAEITALKDGSAPVFLADPISRAAASAGASYNQTLAGAATDPNAGSILNFSKIGGPAWLTVDADGRLHGTPSTADSGINRFMVRVTDPTGLADDAVLNIQVNGTLGLLAHHQFDNNTLDRTGGLSGTNMGGPAYEDGLFDRALRFDGSDDHVKLRNDLMNGLTDVTIAARVKWKGGNNWQRIFDFGNNTTQYMLLTPRTPSGTMRFTITMNGNTAGAEQYIEIPSPAVIGEWLHVAVVLSGNTGTLYVNGAAATSGPITLDPANFSPTLNYLGKSQYNDPYFNGVIDDFRIYSRSLSPAEVSALASPQPTAGVASFSAWSSAISLPAGETDGNSDTDRDGVPNLFEYLLGTSPLIPDSKVLPEARLRDSSQLGASAISGKSYLSFSARVRKERPGIVLIPEAAATLNELSLPASATMVRSAGEPVADGDFEIHTWYYPVAIEDGAKGFMRLRVTEE